MFYRVRLDQFEGPLDLLLFFIQRDEIDVYDIPIAHITEEFLAYVRLLEEIDLDGVGDFLYMASMLIGIKAKMLLPKLDVDEEGEVIDPRRELVERLLEYVRFRNAGQKLHEQFERRQDFFTRGSASGHDLDIRPVNTVVADGSLFDLVSALRRILTLAAEEPVHEIEGETYSVEEQLAYVMAFTGSSGKHSFAGMVRARSKSYIIATFLAILELARLGKIDILISPGANDFIVEPTGLEESDEAPINED